MTGRPTPADDLQGALENSVERLLRAEADRAAERTVTAWRSLPGGRRRCSPATSGSSSRCRRTSPRRRPPRCATGRAPSWTWSAREGADKRSQARLLSWGVNGAGRGGDGRRLRPDRRADRRRDRRRRRHHRARAAACWRRCSATPPSGRSPRGPARTWRRGPTRLLRYEQERFDVLVAAAAPGAAAPPRSCAPPSRELAAARRAAA